MIPSARIGRYELVEELGRGGFAVVYRARDTVLNRVVALKVLRPHWAEDPEFVRRFQQEAQAAANLQHPHIVTIHDTGEIEGRLFIAMEYVSGPTLQTVLKESGALSLEQTVAILRQVADALDYAHAQGVVHRDIKPGNMIVSQARGALRAVLFDFGLVKAAEGSLALTTTGTTLGSPEYMAPEQADPARRAEVGPAADRYALGIVAYQMLTGRVPFPGHTPSVLYAHEYKDVPPPRTLQPDLPPEMDAVLLRMLAKTPAARYATSGEFVRALSGAAAAGAVSTPAETGEPIVEPEVEHESEPPAPAAPTREPGTGSSPVQAGRKIPSWLGWSGAVVVIALAIWGISVALDSGEAAATQATMTAKAAVAGPAAGADSSPTPGDNGMVNEQLVHTVQAGESLFNIAGQYAVTVEALLEANALSSSDHLSVGQQLVIPSLETVAESPSTPDPNTPPPNPTLGSTWVRPVDEMTMVYVPGGTFAMGSEEKKSNEQPVHDVTLDGFWVDRTEVTNVQYAECVADGVCDRSRCADDVFYNGDDLPVVGVNWYDAERYCAWAGGRLPTEAEWEYAARGPDGNTYPWGNASPTCELAQYDSCDGDTIPVGSLPDGASWVGALDMAGNVWEWVSDWYDADYYEDAPALNPQGPESGEDRVLRGGSWYYNAQLVRAAYRDYNDPLISFDSFGFRCTQE